MSDINHKYRLPQKRLGPPTSLCGRTAVFVGMVGTVGLAVTAFGLTDTLTIIAPVFVLPTLYNYIINRHNINKFW